jgi:hypothetical protein
LGRIIADDAPDGEFADPGLPQKRRRAVVEQTL